MNVQEIVTDLTSKANQFATTGQEAAVIGFETLKTANGILVAAANNVVKTNVDAATNLFGEAKTQFEKAGKDGVQAVFANPVAYLPATTPVVEAFNATVATVTEAGTDIAKTFEGGFTEIKAKFNGDAVIVETAKKVTKTAATATSKAAKAAGKKVKAAAKA